MSNGKRRKFYGANPESVRAENVKDGGTFYLDLPDGIELWTPREGDNYIRILPSCDKDFNIWCHIWIHYNPQSKKYFLCPKEMSPKNSSTSPCPVCEEYENLKDAGEEDDVCSQFKAGAKTLFFIIDRDDEKKGVQLYAASRWQVAVDIFDQMEDKRKNITIDIADIDNGYDVVVTKEGKGMHTKYKAFVERESSEIGSNEWEDQLVSFADVLADEPTYDTLKADFFGGGVEEEEEKESESHSRQDADSEEPEEDVPDHSPPTRRSSRQSRSSEPEDTESEKESVRDRLKRKVRSKR